MDSACRSLLPLLSWSAAAAPLSIMTYSLAVHSTILSSVFAAWCMSWGFLRLAEPAGESIESHSLALWFAALLLLRLFLDNLDYPADLILSFLASAF